MSYVIDAVNGKSIETALSIFGLALQPTGTAMDIVNLLRPEHSRTSCSDEKVANGLFSRNGSTWHGRCGRCVLLDVIADGHPPEGFDIEEARG